MCDMFMLCNLYYVLYLKSGGYVGGGGTNKTQLHYTIISIVFSLYYIGLVSH